MFAREPTRCSGLWSIACRLGSETKHRRFATNKRDLAFESPRVGGGHSRLAISEIDSGRGSDILAMHISIATAWQARSRHCARFDSRFATSLFDDTIRPSIEFEYESTAPFPTARTVGSRCSIVVPSFRRVRGDRRRSRALGTEEDWREGAQRPCSMEAAKSVSFLILPLMEAAVQCDHHKRTPSGGFSASPSCGCASSAYQYRLA